ncbi:MAG: glycosyltransferase family 2 protein [Polyangiales bacterium]
MLSGPNMAMRRSCYEAAGGLENAKFRIAEDVMLVQMIEAAKLRSVGYIDAATTVRVESSGTMLAFLSQQRRWLMGIPDAPLASRVAIAVVLYALTLTGFSVMALLVFRPPIAFLILGFGFLITLSLNIATRFRTKLAGSFLGALIGVFYAVFVFPFVFTSTLFWRTPVWRGDGYAERF